jgi:uncharacterized protein with von Willebrand factor type A (vWA) domain
MIKLRDLAAKAGRFLGRSQAPAPKLTSTVNADRFDDITWRDIHSQARAIRDLAGQLQERYDYAADLVKDLFLAAYKAEPTVRDSSQLHPAALPNRQVISCLLDSPEFAELRRQTVGDPYASAMAVLSQADAIRRMLDQTKQAQQQASQAAQAGQDAEDAASAVAGAMAQLTASAGGEDGEASDQDGDAVSQMIAQAEQAEDDAQSAADAAAKALQAAAPAMRQAARQAAERAAQQAQEEAETMAAWGVGKGDLERMSFADRAALAERLRSNRLAEFARLIGRFRQMAQAERARKIENVPGELVGMEIGDDLTRLIPSELVSLATSATRAEFLARYASRQLLVYKQQGETEAGQGAIIAAIDCSYSMKDRTEGISREAWAKALALALLDQAHAAHRDFVAILFSDDVEAIYRFPARQPARITDVISLAENFPTGGTEFEPPLTQAREILADDYNQAGRQRGDIVFITDGVCWVSEEWARAWNEAKARLGFRTFGVQIGSDAYCSALEALSDNVRNITDLTDVRAAADIFRTV